eukprot:TRINITY_DN61891_c0_g1_i1.p1 TRINITY_DN61891_c0_g1~~TRINITY_DN61891_c0_g1_i1.p1  ORF type:complete len:245 (-),score=58.73 TRINITY_DN61891_c0_g1_i1:59-793(-)
MGIVPSHSHHEPPVFGINASCLEDCRQEELVANPIVHVAVLNFGALKGEIERHHEEDSSGTMSSRLPVQQEEEQRQRYLEELELERCRKEASILQLLQEDEKQSAGLRAAEAMRRADVEKRRIKDLRVQERRQKAKEARDEIQVKDSGGDKVTEVRKELKALQAAASAEIAAEMMQRTQSTAMEEYRRAVARQAVLQSMASQENDKVIETPGKGIADSRGGQREGGSVDADPLRLYGDVVQVML